MAFIDELQIDNSVFEIHDSNYGTTTIRGIGDGTITGAISALDDAVEEAGHTILDEDGTSFTHRHNLQFENAIVEDDSTNDITKVRVKGIQPISQADYDELTEEEKNSGIPFYIYDAPTTGGVYIFATASAMEDAIEDGDVPDGAIVFVKNDDV